jgi:phage/plasmid-like protein (TIGR03299 family)
MSGEIYSDDHMVSVNNEVPWHGLGTVLKDKAISAPVALKEAKLDWEVTKEPIFDADQQELKEFKLLRRSDTRMELSVVPKNWNPLQNLHLLEIAEALAQAPGTDDFQPVIETAGSLRNGRIVWALVQTGLRTFAGSQHKQYFLLTNGHYLGRGVRGTMTDVRVVCFNTMSAAERAKCALFTNHYGNVEARIEAAMEALGWANEATRSTFAIYEALAVRHCSTDKAAEFFGMLLPKDDDGKLTEPSNEKVGYLIHLFKNGKGCEGNSYFDALNAVTDWVDHGKEYRLAERRFEDAVIGGNGASLKRQAMMLASKLVMA